MRKVVILFCVLCCVVLLIWERTQAAVHAPGSWATETTRSYGKMKITTLAWAADSTGAVASRTTTTVFRGLIYMVGTDPDSSISPADSTGRYPSDNYDIVIKASKLVAAVGTALDIMGGTLANRDSINTEWATPKVGTAEWPVPIYSTLVITVSGNKKPNARGKIYIHWVAE